LTGSDIINVLGTKYQGRKIILPRIVLRDGEDVFLDGISFRELQETTGADIRVVDGSADSLVNTILSW
jgi:NifB/MoaA-like Fe-S oxidoreductase